MSDEFNGSFQAAEVSARDYFKTSTTIISRSSARTPVHPSSPR
ncbi:hypothetical protein [Rhodopseudomonas palustris]|jgi:hypothetical protein|nr:hypothetical protein [Rhodopseudomonas palustris]